MRLWMDRIDGIVAGGGLCLCLGIVCLEIIARSVFDISFLWSEELSRYLIVLVTYFGAVAAIRSGEHIRIELILNLLTPNLRQALDLFAAVICCIYCGAVSYFGYQWAASSYALGIVSSESTLVIPIWVFYLVIPVGFGLMALRFVGKSWSLARAWGR